MGSGVSTTFDDLSSDEKTEFARRLTNEYEGFRANVSGSEGNNDVLLFEVLRSAYDDAADKIVQKRSQIRRSASADSLSPKKLTVVESSLVSSPNNKPGNESPVHHKLDTQPSEFDVKESHPEISEIENIVRHVHVEEHDEHDEDHPDNLEFALRNSFNIGHSHSNSTPTMISQIDKGQKLLKAKTSSQLLSLMSDSIIDDTSKVADFISQLRSGEVPTKGLTDFRQRRLTYSKETAADESANTTVKVNNLKPVRSRTSIFASSEIGFIHERKPPFPPTILGTYSCHGIEPCPDEIEGIHGKINQDRGCICYPYNSSRNEALFMVLDGHGEHGDKVSEFVMRQIVVSLEKDPLLNTDPVQALKNAYITTNTALLVTDIHYMTSGCTCVTVYCKDKRLYVANTGDSRAVMASLDESGRIVGNALSRDHKPDDPDEMDRINRWGGYVRPPPEIGLSARVYLDPEHTMIGLAMSRSIGDHAVKNVGVIPEPEVKIYDIQDNDMFMIMASDGVWEFINSQEAVEIVQTTIDDGVPDACQELIEQAACRWQEEEGDYRDDITAIVVKVPLPYTLTSSVSEKFIIPEKTVSAD